MIWLRFEIWPESAIIALNVLYLALARKRLEWDRSAAGTWEHVYNHHIWHSNHLAQICSLAGKLILMTYMWHRPKVTSFAESWHLCSKTIILEDISPRHIKTPLKNVENDWSETDQPLANVYFRHLLSKTIILLSWRHFFLKNDNRHIKTPLKAFTMAWEWSGSGSKFGRNRRL